MYVCMFAIIIVLCCSHVDLPSMQWLKEQGLVEKLVDFIGRDADNTEVLPLNVCLSVHL